MMTESKANRDSISWHLQGATALHKWRFYPIHSALKKKTGSDLVYCILSFVLKG